MVSSPGFPTCSSCLKYYKPLGKIYCTHKVCSTECLDLGELNNMKIESRIRVVGLGTPDATGVVFPATVDIERVYNNDEIPSILK
jgi:hypothetical protein